ncbi:PIG-L deacetylase family protein [Corynebacterium freneyi]|uniref:LmbE family N-acetylglucosaminyl deacetylase n=1 Tax=Corynebacterium freneyi TaxID=134034 RepID=A0ABS4U527_9CORY|nr:PIG-L deacetylase family protein [Corynebacterium freneyi]MBP2331310.1 LmbE family N-acetylglucosaminyl deacetylase [Corynebacterium freneyi]QXA52188.1 PIG-L family deacetylase [Corynebacterium freneyi]UBI02449.1 PIG-L family deacetylase [Corynebacterium freneyi]WJZ04067.1 1D-myo-inositol 2-acetamido-2-deoxy-alpha-D-glucopyranoside deacetylase [Corynebacterium freneyi]
MTVPNGHRLAATDDAGVTTADQWCEALAEHAVRTIALDVGRLVVVAPHPDDEVLGLGATMAARSAARSTSRYPDSPHLPDSSGVADSLGSPDPLDVVVCVSDGSASHPGEVAPEVMRGRRQAECEDGARELGIGLRMLDLPDGGLNAADVDAALHPVLDELAPATVAVTWSGDGHPDHHVCAESVQRWIAAREGATLLEFPVWMWHWARPGDPDVPWERLRRVSMPRSESTAAGGSRTEDMTADAFAHKRRALAAHASQLASQSDAPDATVILPPAVVERFFLGDEWVFTP